MSIKTTPLKELWYSEALIQQLKTGKSNRQIARDLFGSDSLCPTCGSHNISPLGKQCATNKRKYEVYRCGDCQSLLRSNTQVGVSNKFSKIV